MEAICIIKNFSPVGKCVYCGAKSNGIILSDEHIIPYGLHGYVILPEASCDQCADITKKFERVCLRRMFGPARIHLGLRTRRKKERPGELGGIEVDAGTGLEQKIVKISDHPFLLNMIDMPHPGILSSPTVLTNWSGLRICFAEIQGDTQARIDRLKGKRVRLKTIVPVGEFTRLLAKIAHCAAIAEFGVDTFDAFLPDFILGKPIKVPHLEAPNLIGGADSCTPPSPNTELLHDVWLTLASRPSELTASPLIVACIQLFACFKMPIYQVVVGQQQDRVA